MADWLEEIEEKKRREEQVRLDEWERRRPAYQAQVAAEEACYERNKQSIDKVFTMLSDYTHRANLVTKACYLGRTREDKKYELFKRRDQMTTLNLKTITINVSHDNFTLHADYPLRKPRYPYDRGSERFEIPINHVSKEHVSEWVKWLAQESGPPRWKDTRPSESRSNSSSLDSWSSWTFIIIGFAVLLVLYFVFR